jgi:hypothetical protein
VVFWPHFPGNQPLKRQLRENKNAGGLSNLGNYSKTLLVAWEKVSSGVELPPC